MVGMIFAAGIGSRLKPWTDTHPKALVPVGDEPMLGRVIRKMVDAGVTRIVVNVHHFASQVVDYLSTIQCPVPVLVSDESDMLLDTGGGLVKALPLIAGEPVLIHNADVLETVDLSAFIAKHNASGADATLLVETRVTSRRFVFDDTARLRGWVNVESGLVRPDSLVIADTDRLRAFDGVHLVSPSLFEPLQRFALNRPKFSITDFYIDCARSRFISGFDIPADARWFDVGRPETLQKARDFISASFV